MSINDLIKRLRKAADALDSLLDSDFNSNIEAARLIGDKVERNLNRPISIHKKRKKYTRTKKHWTQTAKGKKLMSKSMKKAWAKRNGEKTKTS